MNEQKLWGQLWNWLEGQYTRLLFLSLVILANVIVSVAAPISLKYSLDLIPTESSIIYAIIFGILLLLKFFVDMNQTYLVAQINSTFIHKLRKDVFRKVLKNKKEFFDKSISGRLVSRVVNDSNELMNSAEQLSNSFSQLFVLLGVLVTMLYFDLQLTFASVIVAPFLFIAVVSMRKFQRRISRQWREKIASVNANFGEVIGSLSVSKSFGREMENVERFQDINEQTYRAAKIRGMAIFAVGPIQDLLKNIGIITLLLVASQINNLSINLLYLFVLFQGYFYTPITTIARSYNRFQTSFAAVERLLEVMADTNTSEDSGGDISATEIRGALEFRNIDFYYTEGEQVLHSINFSVEEGTTTALVGHTGAGKSTIAILLMGFYKQQKGQLLIDGIPFDDYNLYSLRRQIAYVSQDVFLFSGTLLENLAMGRPEVTEKEVRKALDAVQATEFLNTLPHGLQTIIEEGGKNLSRGQKQMIALARALISDPKILILDKFTSSLDLYTEAMIQEGIATLIKGRSSIVIAHRLTTILHSNQILVLENGRIVERGTHEMLIEHRGKYSELFNTYFSFQLSDLVLKS